MSNYSNLSKQLNNMSTKGIDPFGFIPSDSNGASFNTEKEEQHSYTMLPWVAIAVDALMKDGANREWEILDKKDNVIYDSVVGDINKRDESILAPFLSKFANMTFSQIMAPIVGHMSLTGNGLLLLIEGTAFGKSRKIKDKFIIIEPGKFTIFKNNNGTSVSHYEVTLENNERLNVPPEQVIHFKQNNIFDSFWGVGNIEKMRIMAEAEVNSDEFAKEFLANRATPSLFVKDNIGVGADQAELTSRILNSKNRGNSNAGSIIYMSGDGVDVKSLQISQKDMQYLESKNYTKELTLSLFGVAPEAVGIVNDSNRATIEASLNRYYENINTLLVSLELSIQSQYFDVYSPGYRFKFKKHFTGDVDALIKMINNGLITPNEASKKLGLPVNLEDESRNTYYQPSNLFPMGFVSEQPTETETQKEEEKKKCSHDVKEINNVDLMDPNNWEAIVANFSKSNTNPRNFQAVYLRESLKNRVEIERKYVGSYEKFFKTQKRRVLKRFKQEYEKSLSSDTKTIFDEDPYKISLYLMPEEEDASIIEASKSIHTSGVQRAVSNVNSINNANIDVSLSNPFVNGALSRIGQKVVRINDATRNKLTSVILKSLEEGATTSEISDRIGAKFDEFGPYRSRRIARTEARIAYDSGLEVSYKELGVKEVDVIGCGGISVLAGGEEEFGYCGVQDISITQFSSLDFHPNHIGTIVPSEEL
jgi:HK97 family phage portal protein